MKRLRAVVAACSLLAGCSGGGGTSLPTSQPIANPPANPGAPTSKKRGAAAFSIVIPKATAASEKRLARIAPSASGRRRPEYVSAGTQSLVVVLTAVNSTPVPVPVNYAINVGGAGCTSTSGVTTCTLVVPADAFTIRTYDTAQSSANPASPAGNILSAQTTNVSVVADTANVVSVPVVLDALVASINVSVGAGYGWYGSQTVPITIQLRDAADDLIVGPGAFLDGNGNPITVTLADSDATVTSLPTTSFTATTLANASLSYTGGGLPAGATLTASAPALTPGTTTFAPSVKSGTLFWSSNHGTELWNTTVSPPVHVTTLGSVQMTGVALGANGTVYQNKYGTGSADTILQYTPGSTTATSTPLLPGQGSYSLAVATSGRIYAALSGGGGTFPPVYFEPSSTTAVSVAGTYTQDYAVAIDPASQRLVTSDELSRKLSLYSSNLTQAPTTIATLSFQPVLMTFRSDGTLFVTNINTNNVYSIATPLGTPGAPIQVTSGNLAYGIALDTAGDLFTSTYSGVYKVAAGATLPATPISYITPISAGGGQIVVAP
jgi:hypothetical protein